MQIMKRYWIMLAAGLALLVIDLVVLLFISRDAPSYIYAMIGLALLTAGALILISAIRLMITIIKQARNRLTSPPTNAGASKSYLILVREKATGRIVDKATIEETTPGNRLTDELPKLQGLIKKTWEEKYPAPRYEVLAQITESKPTADLPPPAFQMNATRSSLIIVNLGGIIVGALLLLVLLLVRTIFSLALFIVGVGILTLYMSVDYMFWNRRGIRRINLEANGITLFRGRALIPVRLERNRVTRVDVFRKLNRVKVVIYTGGVSEKTAPGVTLFTGPRVLVTNDAFHDAEFGEFISALNELGYPVEK